MGLDDEERQRLRELFVQFAQTRDRAIRDELIEAHLRLAEHLARRFANRGVALDDLIQVASLGLVKAVERFEPDRGLEFSTFATPTIVGELKRHFRDKGWAVRVPRRVQELHVEVNTPRRRADPAARPLTDHRRAGPHGRHLRGGGARGDGGGPGLPLGVDRRARRRRRRRPRASPRQLGDEDANLFAAENRLLITSLLTTLPQREQLMLRLRFYEGMTQSQIADRLGISQMHVSRLLTKSLALLRDRVEHADGDLRPRS